MKAEYSIEDFNRGVINPYYDKLVKKIEVHVRNEDYELFEQMAKDEDLAVTTIIMRCLERSAELLRMADDDDIY